MADSELLESAIRLWLEDGDGDVVYAEWVEGRWAVRMRQTVRDATTVWWTVGDYTITAEAYVLPVGVGDPSAAYRLALVRNHAAWLAHFALDRDGSLVIRGRLDRERARLEDLDRLLGEIYQMVEAGFRPLVRLAFGD